MAWQTHCPACDNHCAVTVTARGEQVTSISGNRCKKGEIYASNAYVRQWREEHPDEDE